MLNFNAQDGNKSQAGKPDRGERPGHFALDVARDVRGDACPSPRVFPERHPVEQRPAMFDFLGHAVSAKTPQLRCWNRTAALDNS